MRGPERERLVELAQSSQICMSAVAWYEFSRGPRTPEQLAVARDFFADDGIVAFHEDLAAEAARVFRALGSPRRRAADIAIAVTAAMSGALLLTRNRRDFADIPGLRLEATAR